MAKRPTFEQACAQYVNRFTMEHVPSWTGTRALHNQHYAPAYRSDREWYDNTYFPGEAGHIGVASDCYSRNQTWPLGQWLVAPYRKGAANAPAAPKPSYGELLEMLDNVSAALRNVVAAHGASMAKADRDSRVALAQAARLVCDALLREEPDWIALARDAGYDGSPGGEREWCIGNGMTSKVED